MKTIQVMWWRVQAMIATVIVTMPISVFAQEDGGVSPAPAIPVQALAGDDFGALAKLIWDAVMNKQWGLVASLAILLAVAALRKFVPETTKVGAWLRTKLGGIVTNFAITLSGAFATAFMSGHTFSADLVFKALSVALTASGGWAIYKNVREALDEKKAQEKGADAAKKPDDTLNA